MPYQNIKKYRVKKIMQKTHINDKRKICGGCNYFAMDWCWTIGADRKKDDDCLDVSRR